MTIKPKADLTELETGKWHMLKPGTDGKTMCGVTWIHNSIDSKKPNCASCFVIMHEIKDRLDVGEVTELLKGMADDPE